MTKLITKLAGDRKGATAIEYGLIAAFIALAIVGSLPGIRTALGSTFGEIKTQLQSTTTAP
jgi:pilus assembly protein Flp/PilA